MPKTLTNQFELLRPLIVGAAVVCLFGLLLSSEQTMTPVAAFSAGPPAGYTGAPGEEPEACAECHVPPSAGSGQISITAPPTYTPGQTYPITVTHTNNDPTRLRWGFQLTVLDSSDEKAGDLQTLDGLTQILNNQGPGSSRQYIEHTSAGTFAGQQNGATWTFNWTAPATDIGTVVFYAAGNHANNDGNTSGDFIYKTFVAVSPATTSPDFAISISPPLRAVTPGSSTQYNVTVTPLAGFTGTVNLSASGLPTGASANFNPGSLNFTGPTAQNSTLTVSTTGATPLGDHVITINAVSGAITHGAQVTLKIISPSSLDLSITKTASPNPGQVGLGLAYRIVVTNGGPASASNVTVSDTLPAGVTFVSANTSQGSCSGTNTVNCTLGSVPVNAAAIVTLTVTPTSAGQITNTATVSATETDFDNSNNAASVQTLIQAAAVSPTMLDPNLTVSTVISALNQPTTLAFIGPNDFLVLEKATGRVQRVTNGVLQGAVLDLAVNSASERGLLGIALHPDFVNNGYVYLFWTESSTGIDTTNIDEITLLGNRVDRYRWNGSALVFDLNLIKLRALQQDPGQPSRGNHDGGILRFGQDGKLYVLFGDNGRRGFLQNVTTGGTVPDDQFGGPEPDNAHMTGIVLRLNDDGSAPTDNPFFDAATALTGEAANNIKKIYAYGIRNGFGMAVDPLTGNLWTQENGDDAFDEMNRLVPGFNGGWIQVMGPVNRVGEFKSIESTYGSGNLQQLRWPPSNIADTPQLALSRMFTLTGATYRDPEFSWKYAVAPSTLGFVKGRAVGAQFEGDLLVGASRTTLANGYLFRFKFNADRQHFAFSDPDLADLVADNSDKFDITESESLLIGRDFGITTDIQSDPNGNVFVVSLSNGSVYEIKSKPAQLFVATLTGAQEVPPTNSSATGTATLLLSPDETTARVSVSFSGLSSAQTDAHIHGPAAVGVSGPVLFPLPLGQVNDFQISLTSNQVQDLKNGLLYVNVHSSNFTTGEIRGQFLTNATASSVQFSASAYVVGEGEGGATVNVTRIGNSANGVSIDYSTSDCTASNRTDYITTSGTLQFAAGETTKSFVVPIVDDLYAEGSQTINLFLTKPQGGAFLGSPMQTVLTIIDNDTTTPTTNPLDLPGYFVNQHYLDFLNRNPDPGGLAYWTERITSCGNDAVCIVNRRVAVSASFFIEMEFQDGGDFVYRIYRASLGRQPTYAEFTLDRSKVVAGGNLEASKIALVNEFVERAEFKTAYPDSMTNAQFVNKLFDSAGLTPFAAERQQQIDAMNGGKTRAQVLRDVVEIPAFRTQEFNPSFVLMQYFGYLRRDPDTGGYNFWLDVLNNRQPGNFRGMVCAFVTSREYQERFSPVVTRSDVECGFLDP
jgi:uncharacterized repeat protein (TIGR01451 family)